MLENDCLDIYTALVDQHAKDRNIDPIDFAFLLLSLGFNTEATVALKLALNQYSCFGISPIPKGYIIKTLQRDEVNNDPNHFILKIFSSKEDKTAINCYEIKKEVSKSRVYLETFPCEPNKTKNKSMQINEKENEREIEKEIAIKSKDNEVEDNTEEENLGDANEPEL